jgi:type II secretory pathway pseudopilin PulG
MKKQCKSENKKKKAVCRKNSAFCILHSAFLSAFTLLEVMIAAALFGLVVAGTINVYIMCNKLWHTTSLSMQTTRESSLALSRLVYGQEADSGLRSASAIALTNFNDGSWQMTVSNGFGGVQYIYYNSFTNILSNANSIICKDVSSATGTVNNTAGTIRIQLTVEKRDGIFRASNTVGTLVNMRNKP